ncbi:hypothetical protein Q1695_008648 [Nippostrongylus brasiliensis]|nr:hypothetical protein Q1695_008648 [Nippostrongylus brasiliensis]
MEMDEANADGANQPGPVIVSVEITPPSVDDRGIGTEKGEIFRFFSYFLIFSLLFLVAVQLRRQSFEREFQVRE